MELGVTLVSSLVNPDIGDLALTDAGLELVRSDLASEVAQRLHVRFQFFKGEWFLDLDEGAPFYQLILTKSVPDKVIRSVFSNIIGTTEGVANVVSLDYELDKTTRVLSLTFKARLVDGTLFSSLEYGPYVVAA